MPDRFSGFPREGIALFRRVKQVLADTGPLVAWLKENVGRGERARSNA